MYTAFIFRPVLQQQNLHEQCNYWKSLVCSFQKILIPLQNLNFDLNEK